MSYAYFVGKTRSFCVDFRLSVCAELGGLSGAVLGAGD
jgi:hypothetical protein